MATKVNLIDCIGQLTGKEIAMRGETLVYLDTKENVETEIIENAKALQVEKVEESRILDINTKTGEIIYSKYSREKQFNVGHLLVPYTETDKEEMFMYIETVRDIGRIARENGTLLEDINWAGLD